MRCRHYLIAMSTISSAFIACALPPSSADTYEFEVSKELARASAKFDLDALKTAASQGKKPVLAPLDTEPVWKPPEKSMLTVKTGPDALLILGKEHSRVYDFQDMKIYDLNTTAKTYIEHSLYADLAFRKAELKNRLTLRDIVGKRIKKQGADKFLHDFFSEEKFALCLPDRNSGYSPDKSQEGSTDIYKFNSIVVTSFTPGSTALTGDKLRQFSRFLIYATHLHPEIRADIEKSGKLPQKLMCYMDCRPLSKQRTTYVLKKVSPGDYIASVPPGYTQTIDPRNPLAPVYPRIKELGGSPPADLKQRTLEYYKKAVETKNYLDALLAVSEYGLQTGENLSSEMAAIKDQINNDPDCQRLIAGLQAPETEKQAMLALGSLDSIDRTKSSRSYLLDIFRANLIIAMNEHGIHNLETKQDDDPASTFVKVLKQNPFIAGVYHDLGDYLESTNMQPYAWECYELAHKFYPKHPFMKDITEREQELSESFPQFFSGDKL